MANETLDELKPEDIYKIRITAFLDILGFKNFVDQSISDPNLLRVMHHTLHQNHGMKFLDFMSDAMTDLNGKPIKLPDIRVTSFSDSIAVSSNAELGQEPFLLYLCHLSCIFFAANVFFRGGISFGLLHHTESVIFGPALNEAAALEHDAIYPRIVLDERMAENAPLIMISAPDQDSGIFPVFDPIRKDKSDGRTYINTVGYALAMACNEMAREKQYARQNIASPDANPRMWREWPREVKRNVENSLEKFPENSREFKKYAWFAEFFNDAYFNNTIAGPKGQISGSLRQMTGVGVGRQFGEPINFLGV